MLAVVIFVVTLVFVIWQPRDLGIGWSALAGAAVALAAGAIGLSDIPVMCHIVWDATFTFVALIVRGAGDHSSAENPARGTVADRHL